MASYKKYPTTTQPDPIADVSEANVLRARAARYKQLAELMTDPRVIHEVQACALELEADAARLENENGAAPSFVPPKRDSGESRHRLS